MKVNDIFTQFSESAGRIFGKPFKEGRFAHWFWPRFVGAIVLLVCRLIFVISIIVLIIGGLWLIFKDVRIVESESGLNLRDMPNAESKIIKVLQENDELRLLEKEDKSAAWIKVKTKNNEEGYVNKEYVRISNMMFLIYLLGGIPALMMVGGTGIVVKIIEKITASTAWLVITCLLAFFIIILPLMRKLRKSIEYFRCPHCKTYESKIMYNMDSSTRQETRTDYRTEEIRNNQGDIIATKKVPVNRVVNVTTYYRHWHCNYCGETGCDEISSRDYRKYFLSEIRAHTEALKEEAKKRESMFIRHVEN
jgi:hypothetical protein